MKGIGKPLVLLAEDTPAAVVLVERALRKANFQCDLRVVGDGREALLYLNGEDLYSDRERHPLPALLITNVRMPRLSGFELLSWVRRHPQLKTLPVVVISSSDIDADSSQAYALGASSYLVKPISSEMMAEVLRSLDLLDIV
jgi:CheY-like chemotaxis protein